MRLERECGIRHVVAVTVAAVFLGTSPGYAANESEETRGEDSEMQVQRPARGPRLQWRTEAIHSGGASALDRDLADSVASALAAEPRLRGAMVTVTAKEGHISLSGSASSYEQDSIAQRIAEGTAGVRAVSGHLDIQAG